MPEVTLVTAATTLSPLPPVLKQGLTVVSFFGFLSFLTSICLFLRLAYRLVTWKRKSQARVNQFYILIFNLVFADIQQSVSYLLTAQWIRDNAIVVDTPTCWAQGWFDSTGDLASGTFTFAIAVHSFADIVYDYRLSRRNFLAAIVGLWVFIYAMAVIGIAMHPEDFYRRAGAWCWINVKYDNERLWLHYLWVIIAEFGTVLVYSLIFIILNNRVRNSWYTTSDTQLRAKSAAKLIIAYPCIYIVCTLPLVIARLTSMTRGDVSFLELCIAGAFETSNGWLDVLLYTLTRRALLFGPEISEGQGVLDTFRYRPDQEYGTTTFIEANPTSRRTSSRRRVKTDTSQHSRHASTESLVHGLGGVKAQTVVQVRTEAMELDHIGHQSSDGDLGNAKSSFDSRSQKSDK